MSQNNPPPGYWESQFTEDAQLQLSRSLQNDVISVYELFLKEGSAGTSIPDDRNDIPIISSVPTNSQNQLVQVNKFNNLSECIDLGTTINSEVLNVDKISSKIVGNDTANYKISDETPAEDDDMVAYGNPISQVPSITGNLLIDKDDPRSRLHFVKYLKRDGKTIKIWECGICSKEFRHQYTLMRHLPTHTDERNFKCDTCGKAFRQLSTLSQHKAIHSDARPYICEFCKKTFNRVSTLISHRKTHSENKPHKCHLCGKGFHQKGNLRNHVFTHTNERPYKCELCGKGFNQMSNLVCHKVKAHAHAEKMQYICGICGKEFSRRFALRAHEEFKHGIKYRQTTKPQADDTNEIKATRNKSVRIVRLPDGHRKPFCNAKPKDPPNAVNFPDCIVVDKINTKAMENATVQGQTPFALFKPVKGVPVLVKISSTKFGDKHSLTPATPDDLQASGSLSSNPTLNTDADGVKSVQVKVPIVASVTQKVDDNGKFSYLIEPPDLDEEQENLVSPLDLNIPFNFNGTESMSIPEVVEQQNQSTQATTIEDCDELFELAAQGGIQFVRATEDGRYEVMTNNEARELMAQNSHDVTILEGEAADAINAVNKLQERPSEQHEIVMRNLDSRVIVLDSDVLQKPVSLSADEIELLEDKDIQILDGKSLDDRFMDGITFLSPHSKMDDLIVCPKALEIENDGNNNGTMNNDENKSQETSIFSTPNCTSMSTFLNESQHHPIPLLNKSPLYTYPKSIRGLDESLGILADGEESLKVNNDQATVNDFLESKSKLKLNNGDLDNELIAITHPEMKTTDTCSREEDECANRQFVSDYLMSRYQEIKLLDDLARFSKSAMISAMNFGMSSDFEEDTNDALTVSEFGKGSEREILDFSEEIRLAKILDGEKMTMNGSNDLYIGCDTIDVGDSSSKKDHRHSFDNDSDGFFLLQGLYQPNNDPRHFLQSCSGPADFLSLVNRSSPARGFENLDNRFEETCKEEQSVFSTSNGLPDL